MTDTFLYTTPLDPRAVPLIEQLTYEYASRYSDDPDDGEMLRYPPERFAPPHGNFVLLVREGAAIAGGAFMRHDERTAELKRVWTHSAHRRGGFARKVLLELEEQAARQGYTRLFLTTGFRQPEAVGLYLNTGYTALFDTAVDPEILVTLPFEKDISHLTGQTGSRGARRASTFN